MCMAQVLQLCLFQVARTRRLIGSGLVEGCSEHAPGCRDQRLYKQAVSPSVQPPEPLTPEGKLRFADGILDASRQRIITVQEDHSGSGEAVNTIAAVCEQAYDHV